MLGGFGGNWDKWTTFKFALALIFIAPFQALYALVKKRL